MPDGKRHETTQPANPNNLMLTAEYNSSKVAAPAKAPAVAGKEEPSKHDEDESKGIANSAPTDVHV